MTSDTDKTKYVTVLRETLRRAHERRRIAEALLTAQEEHNEHTRQWAHDAFEEQRRLADRLNYVYGVAMAHGASQEELAGSTGFLADQP